MQLTSPALPILSVFAKPVTMRSLQDVLSAVNLFINTVSHSNVDLNEEVRYLIWLIQQVRSHMETQAVIFEGERGEFSLDIDLHEQKNIYAERADQVEKEYQLQLAEYNLAINRLHLDIDDLSRQSEEVSVMTAIEVLKDLALYAKMHREIALDLAAAEDKLSAFGCFQGIFFQHSSKLKCTRSVIRDLINRRELLDSNDIEMVRGQLLSRLAVDMRVKQEQLADLVNAPPQCDDSDRRAYIAIEARIRSDEREYYSCLNHELMLDMLKLHFIINKLSKVMTGGRESILKLKDEFRLYSHGFYCEEPGRHYFAHYLKNMRAIKDNKILDEIIVGKGSDPLPHDNFSAVSASLFPSAEHNRCSSSVTGFLLSGPARCDAP